MKKHWRNLSEQPYLGAWDLEDEGEYKPVIVTIEKIYNGQLTSQLGKQQKSFVKFKEFPKSMVCNTTNFRRLENRFRTFDYEQYIGQRVILQVEKVKSPEGQVDALRFSSKPPQDAPKKKTPLTDERFNDALNAITNGAFTKDQLKEKHELTPQQLLTLDAHGT